MGITEYMSGQWRASLTVLYYICGSDYNEAVHPTVRLDFPFGDQLRPQRPTGLPAFCKCYCVWYVHFILISMSSMTDWLASGRLSERLSRNKNGDLMYIWMGFPCLEQCWLACNASHLSSTDCWNAVKHRGIITSFSGYHWLGCWKSFQWQKAIQSISLISDSIHFLKSYLWPLITNPICKPLASHALIRTCSLLILTAQLRCWTRRMMIRSTSSTIRRLNVPDSGSLYCIRQKLSKGSLAIFLLGGIIWLLWRHGRFYWCLEARKM